MGTGTACRRRHAWVASVACPPHRSVDAAGERIADLLCAVASGEPTASERLGYGDEEFTPWLDGITL